MILVFDIVAILVVALMTGNEVAISVFVHPALSRLDDQGHAAAARALARRLGRVMPFWYAGSLVLAGVVAATRPVGSASQWLAGSASVLIAAAIVYTILGPVPINNRVAAWNLSALPEDWLSDRRRWDRLHAIRAIGLLAAIVLLTWAVVDAN